MEPADAGTCTRRSRARSRRAPTSIWPAEGFTDGQRRTRRRICATPSPRTGVLLSLGHNMAQSNGMTAAMIDVLTEYVHNSAIPAAEGQKRLVAAVAGAQYGRVDADGRDAPRAHEGCGEDAGSLAPPPRRRVTELAIWLPLVISAGHVVVFTAWTTWVSFTASALMPELHMGGLAKLLVGDPHRELSDRLSSTSLIFGCGFVLLTTGAGSAAGDPARSARARRKRAAHDLSLSLAVSFVVTGTVWSWLLNPGLGIQRVVQNSGWTDFRFDWLVQPRQGDLHARSSPVSGRAPALPWRCSSRGCGRWTRTWSRPRRSTAPARGGCTARVLLPTTLADLHHRVRDPAAVGDHRVRPRAGADRRRTGHLHQLPTLVVYDFDVPAQRTRPRLGRGGPDAAVAGRGDGALRGSMCAGSGKGRHGHEVTRIAASTPC